jgi:hypothetical protein
MEDDKHVSPQDSEKGPEVAPRRASVGGTDLDLSTGRESDFMTRNGLNLKSFQRRELHPISPTVVTP